MAYELMDNNREVRFSPGPFDVHMHPRATDPTTQDAFVKANGGIEGKVKLWDYTVAALKSGIVGGGAMPNELMRIYDLSNPEKTSIIPYPISNLDRVRAMQAAIHSGAAIPMMVYAGIDPKEILSPTPGGHNIDYDKAEANFAAVKDDVMALKLWGDQSTGGFNIPLPVLGPLANRWYKHNPEKPVILHVEDGNVETALRSISYGKYGKEIPVHIAHVSSREELEAVISAKKDGMNVTCEVTIHHLFLDAEVRKEIGGYGCMKPSLKSKQDVAFLWANLDQIDVFASDCAPHRVSDKEAEVPAFGVTNHSVMLPLLLGAESQGRLTMQDIDEKFCTNPRKIFGLPAEDSSYVNIDLQITGAHTLEEQVNPKYGQNPFLKVADQALMVGRVIGAQAGESRLNHDVQTSYTHLIRPANLGQVALL